MNGSGKEPMFTEHLLYMPGTVSHLALKTVLLVGIIILNFEDLGTENQIKWHDFCRIPVVDCLNSPTIIPCRAESKAGPLQLPRHQTLKSIHAVLKCKMEMFYSQHFLWGKSRVNTCKKY